MHSGDLGPADRILQKTPITFDVSGWELWLPLISGACCVFLPPGDRIEPGRIEDALHGAGITLAHFVPSMLREFLAWPRHGQAPGLRAVICSGEALTPALVRQFSAALPGTALHNLYGPTEAAIDVTAWACPPRPDDLQVVPIGMPIDNCVLAVLDPRGHVVPAGTEGELCIGGVPLATGYVGRPDLTDAVFRSAPEELAEHGVERIYRTGDRARIVDGVVHYLGRLDNQCKVRGQRVEPAEVEAAFETLPAVSQAVVVPYQSAGETRLAAFVACAVPTTVGELRSAVSEALPPGWVPSAIAVVDTFPLSRSGKADRRALAELAARDTERDADPPQAPPPGLPAAGPDTPEGEVAAVWSAVAGPAGLSFLDAGGTSMGAARLSAAIARAFRRLVPARWLIEANPDLPAVFDQIRQAPPYEAAFGTSATEGSGADAGPVRFEAAPNQRRLWLLSQLRPADTRYNVVAAVLVGGFLDAARLTAAVDRVGAAHTLLRSRFADDGSRLGWRRSAASRPSSRTTRPPRERLKPRTSSPGTRTGYSSRRRRRCTRCT